MGYYFIHVSLKHHNELAWQVKVEKDEFHPDQLQTISMAITFPYQPDQKEYQPVDKSIQLDRKFYRVIKQKYARDTLHLVYINDPSSKRIHSAFENWVNQLTQNDNAANENQSVLKALYKQYYHHNVGYWSLQSPLCHQNHLPFFLQNFEQIYQRVPVPPPRHQFA